MNLKFLENYKRIVIKIGSALLFDEKHENIRSNWLEGLGQDIAKLKEAGHEIIIVTSGSIAVGCKYLNIHRKHLKIEEKQAVASYGQTYLINLYKEEFKKSSLNISQILITIDDSEDRRRYLNFRNTVETLLSMGIIPVINENDTVATDEIRFSDNDRLAARVTIMASSDLLVLLSDIDGMYDSDPNKNKDAKLIPTIENIDENILSMAGDSASIVGTGGMKSKVAAALMATESGTNMIIAAGKPENPISSFLNSKRYSLFKSHTSPANARKQWIAHLIANGSVTIDLGAAKAIKAGKSLLPAGVMQVDGKFERGDAILIRDVDGNKVGQGLIGYASTDAEKIIGKQSEEIRTLLGYTGRDELIHRDDMVL